MLLNTQNSERRKLRVRRESEEAFGAIYAFISYAID